MSESILKTLKAEHHQIKSILDEISKSFDVERKKELYLQMKDILIPHMQAEEKTIYAHLIDDVHEEEAEELAQHAKDEHRELRELMSKLDNTSIESESWDDTFYSLKTQFSMHVEEEENELFAEAKIDFTKEELREFGEEFYEAKQHSSHY